jgi:hypothetical protein
MAGLEGGFATSEGAVLLWGWLSAPLDAVPALTCLIDGEARPVELVARMPRPDVAEMLAGVSRGLSGELGFFALTWAGSELVARSGSRLGLQIDADGASACCR